MPAGHAIIAVRTIDPAAAYPPSFSGSTTLYGTALFSVTAIAFMGLMVAGWMARDIWRDRMTLHPKRLVTVFRLIVMLAASAAFIRSAPEALYLFWYGEAPPEWMNFFLLLKRFADTIAIVPAVMWMTLMTVSYAGLVIELRGGIAVIDPWSPWHKLVRPAAALLIIGVVSFLVAIGK